MSKLYRAVFPVIVAILTATSAIYAVTTMPEDYPQMLRFTLGSFFCTYVVGLTYLAWKKQVELLNLILLIIVVALVLSVGVGFAVFLDLLFGP